MEKYFNKTFGKSSKLSLILYVLSICSCCFIKSWEGFYIGFGNLFQTSFPCLQYRVICWQSCQKKLLYIILHPLKPLVQIPKIQYYLYLNQGENANALLLFKSGASGLISWRLSVYLLFWVFKLLKENFEQMQRIFSKI